MPCLTHHWCPWMCSITGDTWTASTPAGPKKSRHSNCTSTCGHHPYSAWLHQMMKGDFSGFWLEAIISPSIKILMRRFAVLQGRVWWVWNVINFTFPLRIPFFQRHLRLLRMGCTWPDSASKLHNSIPTASHRKRYVVVVLPHHHRAPDLQAACK